ncbi:glycosyl hydrolase family 79 C-terminal domain-containing protein [Aspergillus affinis]|uniref:glycosyl hydrolase family 79 C-terminal domain-containing protein n=1 Tax=Aspergillus affinis TaxID=1070780 RepID=UPI0022FEFF67|nr:uncharacterized protein KD926_002146 [Aspergillus affinis]KAI9036237.1 hypothetical protein KD926_002146 [Aspergillus affinis]
MRHLQSLLLLSNWALASSVSIKVPLNASRRILRPDLYGYSIEPVSLDPYLKSTLASTVLGHIAEIAGVPAPIRVGGNIADQTVFDKTLPVPSQALPNDTVVEVLKVQESWYNGWTDYFPTGTDFIYTLNLRNESSSWTNAMQQAEAAIRHLGPQLSLLELGNEIDHYISKGWRTQAWNTSTYTAQWKRLTHQLTTAPFYRNTTHKPRFQAAVFADPPWVPDQHDEIDDFDIANVTRAGLINPHLIESYAMHLYPQSTCDAPREARLSLNLLSNHNVIWTNISQYIPQVAAAERAHARLTLGETNSASCSGRSGISDTFGAALWATDYVLAAASIGMDQVYFHLGHTSEYSAFTPLAYDYKGESLVAGVRAHFMSHVFLAHVVGDGQSNQQDKQSRKEKKEGQGKTISALPGAANSSDLAGYAVYGGRADLEKLVFVDLGVWNSSEGVTNPSTLRATDSNSTSVGERPTRTVEVKTGWTSGAKVDVLRLQGPGTNAKSGVTVSGLEVDVLTGALVGEKREEQLVVGRGGVMEFELQQAEAILLEILKGGG